MIAVRVRGISNEKLTLVSFQFGALRRLNRLTVGSSGLRKDIVLNMSRVTHCCAGQKTSHNICPSYLFLTPLLWSVYLFPFLTNKPSHTSPLLPSTLRPIQLDLGNVISGDFTASFNVTLTATYYQPTTSFPKPTTPDQIVGLSSGNETLAAYFETPPVGVTEVVIPEVSSSRTACSKLRY